MRQWIFAGLILQMVFIGSVEAKDYSTDLGPYHVNFSIDNRSILASHDTPDFGKSENIRTTDGGVQYYVHRLAATYSVPPSPLEVSIYEYSKPVGYLEFAQMALTHQEFLEKRYYRAYESQEITIDGHEGILTTSLAGLSSTGGDVYMFAYPINDRTMVNGICYLDWNKTVEPILGSLNVTLRPVKGVVDADGDNFLDWSYDYARGNITFIMDYPALYNSIIVPAGTEVYAIREFESEKIFFTTTEDGIIEIGQNEVTVPIKAKVDGPHSNVDAHSIRYIYGYVAGISECENREPVAVWGVE